ncbi:hypothetical protein Ancab_007828 [Ancistrocladus abbreviatus]
MEEQKPGIGGLESASITDPQPNPSSLSNNKGQDHSTAVRNYDEYMDVQLYEAAATDDDDVDAFISALEKVSDQKGYALSEIFQQVSPSGNTLLHVAASHHNEKIVRLIAYHCPALIMKQNNKGDSALHLAARTGDNAQRAAASALHRRGPDRHVSVVGTLLRFREDWIDPLASDEWVQEVRALPDDVKLLRVKNIEGNTALHEALINGQKYVAFSLFEEDPEVSYFQNVEGESPLYLAAKAGYQRLVSLMLSSRYLETGRMDEILKGKSPLQAAINRRDKELINAILEKEPRFIDSRDREGRTALHCAASKGYIEVVKYLIGKYPASVVQRDSNGSFPIHLAGIEGHIEIVHELLQHCPDPSEMLNHSGHNILHVAANAGKHDVFNNILRNPALECLINQKDYDGNTSLQSAIMNLGCRDGQYYDARQ